MSELMPGWLGIEKAKEEFDKLGGLLYKDCIGSRSLQTTGVKVSLYDFQKKVLGDFPPNYPQEVGDCTSFSGKNAVEALAAVEIALNGDAEKWRPVFPPFIYGAERVWIGGGSLWGDGGVGIWVAKALQKYGVLFSDEPNVPKYSGSIAKSWGRSAPPKQFADIAKAYPVKQYAQVNSWEEVVDNVSSGRPVMVCSNQGFSYTTDSQKMNVAKGHWSHAMLIYAIDTIHPINFGIILNSWGNNIFEQLTDFDTGDKLPPGVIRARAEVIDSMVKAGDSWAISSFDGFPDKSKEISRAMFDLI